MQHEEEASTPGRVEKYYDEFRLQQKKLGINLRHRTIRRHLKKLGLKKTSNVLEVGCGIGTVSHLILEIVKKGTFVGADISGESLGIARQLNSNSPNATFVQTDMSDFSRPERFDFFVFPDVLEHIPVEQHAALFRTVAAHAAPGAKIFINIPEPECLDWMRHHHPEKLQIIDQSLSLSKLIADVEAAGFYLRSVTPYRLFHDVDEYVSLVFAKRTGLKQVRVDSVIRRFMRNVAVRFS